MVGAETNQKVGQLDNPLRRLVRRQTETARERRPAAIFRHPNNVLIAVGTSDYRVLVFSAYIKEVFERLGRLFQVSWLFAPLAGRR